MLTTDAVDTLIVRSFTFVASMDTTDDPDTLRVFDMSLVRPTADAALTARVFIALLTIDTTELVATDSVVSFTFIVTSDAVLVVDAENVLYSCLSIETTDDVLTTSERTAAIALASEAIDVVETDKVW